MMSRVHEWKKYGYAFLLAFGLNFVWENLHGVLYVHYQGGVITEFVLLRATLVDAVIITLLIAVAELFPPLAAKRTVVFFGGIIVAVVVEKWALATGRWAYADAMPIIPLLKTGITPTIQLALTGLAAYLPIFRRR